MPCNTITTVKLELKNVDLELMRKALIGLGKSPHVLYNTRLVWTGKGRVTESYDKTTGQLTVRDETTGGLVKRAYSEQVLLRNAARYGWQVKKTADNQYTMVRR